MKKLLLGLFVCLVLFGITACGKKVESDGPFTITCTSEGSIMEGIQQTNKTIYHFSKEQYITDYEVTTVSKYDNAETYKFYKKSSEETVNSNVSTSITYNVKGDDATNTLTFGYKVTFNAEDLEQANEKEYYKAVNVLKRAEESGTKCTVEGIDKKDIK